MPTPQYKTASNLEVPGIEAILEYGNTANFQHDRIRGAMLINDQSQLDRVHIRQIDGLHDDPETSEGRQPSADRHGEHAGNMLYRGRTIGLTGRVQAGNIGAMRNSWRRFRGQFGTSEQDLLIHHPFEVAARTNQTVNPLLDVDGYGWEAPTTTAGGTATGTDGAVAIGNRFVGRATLTGATGAGRLLTGGYVMNPFTGLSILNEWTGEDVWLTARVRGVGTGISSLGIGINQHRMFAPNLAGTTFPTSSAASASSPTSGTWYELSARVAGSAIAINTTHLSVAVMLFTPGAGTYTLYFTDVGMVFLDPEDPTPTTYFAGSTPGYSWDGVSGKSTSSGPYYAQNLIVDPRFESYVVTNRLLDKWTNYSAGLTVNQAPARSQVWTGDHVDTSLYHKATHDATTTSRAMGVNPIDPSQPNNKTQVLPRRTYRLSFKVNVVSKPPGALTAKILWYDINGGLIATVAGDPLVVGVNDAVVTATAPAAALGALVEVSNSAVTTASSVLEMYVSDPCFVDVTDWDPGDFYGTGDAAEEVDRYRRIPRPFLLRGVRKTGDMKAPEQQTRNRAWRDFTMSLRASDPRIYCLDARHNALRLAGTPQFFSTQSEVFTGLDVSTGAGTDAPVPTGYTYEGQEFVNSEPIYDYGVWTKRTSYPSVPAGSTFHPNSGVGLSMWKKGDNSVVSDYLRAPPTASIVARVYRSLEGYTYGTPRVVAGCSPTSTNQDYEPGCLGRGWTYDDNGNIRTNYFAILIKRIDANTWLELRWKPTTAAGLGVGATDDQDHYAFELWCSHDEDGVSATTRLAQWDWTSYDSASLDRLPWDPATNPRWLTASINTSNVVKWELWSNYPSPIGTSSAGLIESRTYTLPSGLIALLGNTHPGQTGWSMYVSNASTLVIQDRFEQTAGALTGKVTTIGAATWTALGAANDADDWSVDATNDIATRTAATDTGTNPGGSLNLGRYLTVGTTNYGAVTASVDINYSAIGTGTIIESGLVLRAQDASNLLRVTANLSSAAGAVIRCRQVLIGSFSSFLSVLPITFVAGVWYRLTVIVDTAGRLRVWWNPVAVPVLGIPIYDTTAAILASTGGWATGKFGIYDSNDGASVFNRSLDNFTVYNSASSPATSCTPWYQTGGNTPFLHYFETSDVSVAIQSVTCNVIGNVDTPPKITLKGNLVNPVISMTATNEADEAIQSQARFIGTFTDANPVTIDVANGSITDSNGLNVYGLLQPGSSFLNLYPGSNIVSLQASNWDSAASNHIDVSWRDALV